MPASQNLRRFVAWALTCTLIVTGLISVTTEAGRAARRSLPPSSAPTVNALVPQAAPVDEATREHASEAYSKLPLSFEENRGQVEAEVRYIARGAGYTLFLTPTEAVLTLRQSDGKKAATDADARRSPVAARPRPARSSVLRMNLLGANPAPSVAGEDVMEARANYFIGNDPQKWHTGVARFGRVRYAQVYPGVDMIYYGREQQLEYDFEVAPGADTRRIGWQFSGVSRVKLESATGELVLTTANGEVRQRKPVAYQEVGGERREVASRYVPKGRNRVGIEVGEYDHTRRLVIDPVLSYSTYLGGTIRDIGTGIAVDSAGNAYVTGWTQSLDFPTRNQYQTNQTYTDAFVSKINPNLSGAASLLYSTYLGGSETPCCYVDSGSDYGTGIAVDPAGNAYVTGYTNASDFPILNQYQTHPGGGDFNAFVAKLNPNLSGAASLLYSTYLGGTNEDSAGGIAVDSAGIAYVTGTTYSVDFPRLHQYQSDQPGSDVFVAKLDMSLSGAASLLYSTYLGGGKDDSGSGIAVDPESNAYVTGTTFSANFPKRNYYQAFQGGLYDAFVTRLDTKLSGAASLVYSTHLGGRGGDRGSAIAVDIFGTAYVTGTTSSPNFPTVNAYQPNLKGPSDAFLARLYTYYDGPYSLAYSSYLGGSDTESGAGVALGREGLAYVTGTTGSTDFPTLNQYKPRSPDEGNFSDAFVTKFETSVADGEQSFVYSTYLGGSSFDQAHAIAVDAEGDAYVTGETWSRNFPTLRQFRGWQAGYFQSAFVTKLKDTFLISGRAVSAGAVDLDGLPLGIDGVTVTLSGTQSRTVVTNRTGNFFFSNLQKGGTYTITFARGALVFDPPSLNFVDLQYNVKDFYANTRPADVSGRVTVNDAAGPGLSGVTMTVTGGPYFTPLTVTTSSTGAYSFKDLPTPGNYKITPSKTNFSFTPGQLALLGLAADQTNVNYVATPRTYTVGGVIKFGAAGLAGVTVKLTSPTPVGFSARTATTDSAGVYSFPNLPAGRSYNVTPALAGYRFTPTNQWLTNLSANQTTVNFSVKVYSLSGRVVRAGTMTGIGAVTMTLTSPTPAGFDARTAETNGTGYYTFTNLPAGRSYTVAPSKTGFTFSPAKRSLILSGNVPAGTSTSFTGTGP